MDAIDELLSRGIANIIPRKDALKSILASGRKLNIYLGIDPTATKIHLGHAVNLRKLQQFSELGHTVTFLIGDFTALIGDTSDKQSERPVLTQNQIQENFRQYKEQAGKVLDFTRINIRYNSEWLGKLTFTDIITLTQYFSLNDFISRELIHTRLTSGKHIRLDEALYPIMQGYDSYYMETDIQLGGTDQTFNMQAGRTLQKLLRNKESFVITSEFLMGTDGRKMSKTGENAIWLDDNPKDMFAKVMAINDELILSYYLLATSLPLTQTAQIEKELQQMSNPLRIKKSLARQIVSEIYNPAAAEKAEEDFQKTVQQHQMPDEIQDVTLGPDDEEFVNEDLLVDLNLVDSKSDAKRLFEQGGVSLDGIKINSSDNPLVKSNAILRVGKRKIVRLKKT